MILHVEQTLLEYLEKYGYLFENDSFIILQELEAEKIKDKYKKKKEELKQNKETILQKLKDFGISVGTSVADDTMEKIEEKMKKVKVVYLAKKQFLNIKQAQDLSKLKKGGKSGVIISGTTLAAILIFSAFKLYQAKKKMIYKKCNNKKGIEKRKCRENASKFGLVNRLYFLKSSLHKCNNSKDPISCKSKIDKEILKIKGKIEDFGSEVGSSMVRRFD